MNTPEIQNEVGESTLTKFIPGMKQKPRRPTTIAGATASLQQNIDDLKYVNQLRSTAATEKAEEIDRLTQEKADDEKEATGAGKLATKLENFLFGND